MSAARGPDLATTTLEVKNRLSHVSGSLHKLAAEPGLIFADPLIHLNIAELPETGPLVRRAWFP